MTSPHWSASCTPRNRREGKQGRRNSEARGPGWLSTVDGGLIPRPELVEHPPKLGALPVSSGRFLAEDVAVVHARLGHRLKLKRSVLVRGGDAGVAEPASYRPKTPCGKSVYSHGLSARQGSSVT